MRTNYMMTVEDVMNELGVKRSKAYSILKQLNNELEKEGYVAVRGKIPRPYWETKFYGFSQKSMYRRVSRCQFIKTKHREPGTHLSDTLTGRERKDRR